MGVRSRPRAIGSGRERTPAAATRRLCRQVSLPPPSRGREEKDNSENTLVSVQLRDREAVGLGADLNSFLAARQRLGDGFQRHALFRERMELVDLGRGPRLFVAFEPVLHAKTSGSAAAARISIASSRP